MPTGIGLRSCIERVLFLQQRLNNTALLGLITHKFPLRYVLRFLKRSMLCERGARADTFLEVLVSEFSSRVSRQALIAAARDYFDEE